MLKVYRITRHGVKIMGTFAGSEAAFKHIACTFGEIESSKYTYAVWYVRCADGFNYEVR